MHSAETQLDRPTDRMVRGWQAVTKMYIQSYKEPFDITQLHLNTITCVRTDTPNENGNTTIGWLSVIRAYSLEIITIVFIIDS